MLKIIALVVNILALFYLIFYNKLDKYFGKKIKKSLMCCVSCDKKIKNKALKYYNDEVVCSKKCFNFLDEFYKDNF